MICTTIGQTSDKFESIYTTIGGVEEVAIREGSIGYQELIFYKTQTMTGDAPLMYDSYPGVLTDYTILGNSYQDGVPDPDHPVEVVSVGDLVTSGEHAGEYVIPVTVQGENLFDKDATDTNNGYRGNTYIKADGASYPGFSTTEYISVNPGKYYIQNFGTSGWTQGAICWYDMNKVYLGGVSYNGTFYQDVTIPENACYVRMALIPANKDSAMFIRGNHQSSAPISYHSYYHQTYPIYLSEPLRRIGDYADEIDFKAGTVTRRIGEVVVTGEEGWHSYGSTTGNGPDYTARYFLINLMSDTVMSSELRFATAWSPTNGECVSGWGRNGIFIQLLNQRIGVTSDDTIAQRTSKFVEYMRSRFDAGTPVILYCVPSTPTTESITPPAIATVNGANTLSIDTTLPPSQLSITGHIKPSSSYGNLTDVKGVYIKDKDGVQIKVTG